MAPASKSKPAHDSSVKARASLKSLAKNAPQSPTKNASQSKQDRSKEASVQEHPKSEGSKLKRDLKVLKTFRSFDANGQGEITREELFIAMQFISKDRGVPEEDLERLVQEIKTSEDSIIHFNDFAAWVAKGSSEAIETVERGSRPHFLEERLAWCLEQLAIGEAKLLALKPKEIWFGHGDNIGISFGSGSEGKANVVKRLVHDAAAHCAGVRIGWQVVSVGKEHVIGTTYVPDVIRKARETGGVTLTFWTPEALEKRSAVQDCLSKLSTRVDLARRALENYSDPADDGNTSLDAAPRLTANHPEDAAPRLTANHPEEEHDVDQRPAKQVHGPSEALAIYKSTSLDDKPPTYDQLMQVMGYKEEDEAEKLMENPYAVLGVAFTASQEEIKVSFMQLAKIYHPDKFPEDPKAAKHRFDRIKKAYDSLRSVDVRVHTDSKIVQKCLKSELYTSYATATYSDRQKLAAKMIKVPDHLNVDPDADPGCNEEFREKGVAVIQYYDYKMPFPVPEGRLATSEIDRIYGLTDAMPGCELHLAEWRHGRTHIVRYGESDPGTSPMVTKCNDVFVGLQPGLHYFLLVQEGQEEFSKRKRDCDARANQREATARSERIEHKCEEEQIYVFGLGWVCRVCSDKDHEFR